MWRDLYRAIACRYVPADVAEDYIQNTIDQPRALIGVSLADARVTHLADAGRGRGADGHLGPPLLPRRHEDGAAGRRGFVRRHERSIAARSAAVSSGWANS